MATGKYLSLEEARKVTKIAVPLTGAKGLRHSVLTLGQPAKGGTLGKDKVVLVTGG